MQEWERDTPARRRVALPLLHDQPKVGYQPKAELPPTTGRVSRLPLRYTVT